MTSGLVAMMRMEMGEMRFFFLFCTLFFCTLDVAILIRARCMV